MNNPYGAIVESAHAGNVDSVFVAGKARKRNHRLADVDIAALRRKVDTQRDALFGRAGVPVDGSWLPRPFGTGENFEREDGG